MSKIQPVVTRPGVENTIQKGNVGCTLYTKGKANGSDFSLNILRASDISKRNKKEADKGDT